MRVGALVGGLLGATAAAVTDVGTLWWVMGGGAIGAGVGYASEKRKVRSD